MATPQPKPSDRQQARDLHNNELDDLTKTIPDIIVKADDSTNKTILNALRRAGEIPKSNRSCDYWTTDAGQAELLRKIHSRS